jgi:hypothetical protein
VNNGHDSVNNGHDSVNNGHDSVNNGHDSVNNGHDSVNNGHDSVNNGHDSVNNGHDSCDRPMIKLLLLDGTRLVNSVISYLRATCSTTYACETWHHSGNNWHFS